MRKQVLVSVMALFSVLLLACPGGRGESEQAALRGEGKRLPAAVQSREYRFPLISDPVTLDPAQLTDSNSAAVARQIHATLVEFDPDGNLRPALAQSWEVSDDGTTYTFHLVKGAKFHNGREIKADDVVYSLTRLVDPAVKSPRADLLFPVVGAKEYFEGKSTTKPAVKALDDYTVEIGLKEPYAPFIDRLAMLNCAIIPREEVERLGDQFGNQPVGAGPFKFELWDRDSILVLERHEGYYRGEPWLRRIIFKIMKDEAARLQAFKAGELDHTDVPAGQLRAIKEDPKLKKLLVMKPALDMYAMAFNTEKGIFAQNPKLRLALNYAVDKENIVENVLEGAGVVMKGYVPEGTWYDNPDFEGYPYDPEKAKELLAEAGYPDGEGLPEITIYLDTQTKHRQIAEAIHADLSALGLKVSINTSDWGAFLNRVYSGEFELAQNTWLADYPDPDNYLYQLLDSHNLGSAGNIGRYQNPRFDALVRQAQVELDQEKRAQLYRQAEAILAQDAPWLLLFQRKVTLLVQPWVKGLIVSNMDRAPQLSNTPLEDVRFE